MDKNTMDHRALIASLTDLQRKDLTRKSDLKGIAALLIHVGFVVLIGSLILMDVPFWQLLLLPQGIFIIFLFTTLHETIHRTAFESQSLNDWVAQACGILLCIQANWFRYFHFAHHRHTQDPEMDPKLASPKPESWSAYLLHVSGLPVWHSSIGTLFRHAVGTVDENYVPAGGIKKIVLEARIHILVYGSLLTVSFATGSTLLLYLWIIPVVLGQPFLRLYLLAEHGRCPTVANMLENSRTTFTNSLMRRLAWNMPYHAEHHSYPSVPFHQLPKFHAISCEHLRQTENGYRRFNRNYVATFNE